MLLVIFDDLRVVDAPFAERFTPSARAFAASATTFHAAHAQTALCAPSRASSASVGTRAQSAKTYLEKYHAEFPTLELDALIKHALKALAGCVPSEKELDKHCASIAIVGDGMPLRMLDGDDVQPYLDQIELEGGEPASDPMST